MATAAIAGYRIDGVLGSGATGTVYEAAQLSLNRSVALKVLAPELSHDPVFRERFLREGVVQAGLDHPHVLPVYEAGEAGDGLFIAMRLVRGPSLRELIDDGALTPQRALHLLGQVAGALDAAHAAGLSHRDVKPQNVLVARDDYAFLADFGLTRAPGERPLTRSGGYVGTLDYSAPEQIRGEPIGPSGDVYALACVLFESLTGAVPYPRENDAATLYAHLSDPPPQVTALRPDLPAALDDVLARGLAKEPAGRPATAGELVAAAAAALGGTPAAPAPAVMPAPAPRVAETIVDDAALAGALPRAVAPPARRWRPSRLLLALALLLLAGAIAAGVLLGLARPHRAAAQARTYERAGVAVTVPPAWRPVVSAVVPGLVLDRPVALARGTQRLLAGRLAARGDDVLPRAFAAQLVRQPLRQPVRIGGLAGYRYAGLEPRGLRGTLDLLLVPAPGGTVAFACTVPPLAEARLPGCDALASTLRLRGATPYALQPESGFGEALATALRVLARARNAGLQQLRAADRPRAQGDAAAAVARAYQAAGLSLADSTAPPLVADRAAAVVAALRRAGGAYANLAQAAHLADRAGYAAARRAARASDADVGRALDALRRFGYGGG